MSVHRRIVKKNMQRVFITAIEAKRNIFRIFVCVYVCTRTTQKLMHEIRCGFYIWYAEDLT